MSLSASIEACKKSEAAYLYPSRVPLGWGTSACVCRHPSSADPGPSSPVLPTLWLPKVSSRADVLSGQGRAGAGRLSVHRHAHANEQLPFSQDPGNGSHFKMQHQLTNTEAKHSREADTWKPEAVNAQKSSSLTPESSPAGKTGSLQGGESGSVPWRRGVGSRS